MWVICMSRCLMSWWFGPHHRDYFEFNNMLRNRSVLFHVKLDHRTCYWCYSLLSSFFDPLAIVFQIHLNRIIIMMVYLTDPLGVSSLLNYIYNSFIMGCLENRWFYSVLRIQQYSRQHYPRSRICQILQFSRKFVFNDFERIIVVWKASFVWTGKVLFSCLKSALLAN